MNNSGYYDFKELLPSGITINPTSGLMASAWLSQPPSARSQIEGEEKKIISFSAAAAVFPFFSFSFCYPRLWAERQFRRREEGVEEE